MITTTYRRLNEASAALQSFYSQPQDYELRVVLMRQAEVIWAAMGEFKQFKDALFRTHATPGDGEEKLMVRSAEAARAFNEAMDAFQDRELRLDVAPISEDMLRGIRMSPLEHLALKRSQLLLGL